MLQKLVNCPDCSRTVSYRANVCIHCGAPLVSADHLPFVPENPHVNQDVLGDDFINAMFWGTSFSKRALSLPLFSAIYCFNKIARRIKVWRYSRYQADPQAWIDRQEEKMERRLERVERRRSALKWVARKVCYMCVCGLATMATIALVLICFFK